MTSLSRADRAARRRTILFGALLAVSVGLMVVSSTGPASSSSAASSFAFRPIQSGLDSIARGVSGLVETVTEIDTLHRTNDELARENARLSAENARTKELERQNEILTGLLEVKGSLGFSTVTGSSRRPRELPVPPGRDDRCRDRPQHPRRRRGRRGRRRTGRPGDRRRPANSATILLVNDTSSTVIGQLGTNQATGSVIGQLGGVLIMENIDSTERLQIGDTVTTAGIDLGGGVRSPFPKGLLIGTVVDVARDANAVTQTAFIQPAADLERLEYVLVITDYDGGLPPVDQPSPCPSDGTQTGGDQPCATPSPAP